LRRVLHLPRKRGAVIRSPDPEQTIQTRSAPAWDPVEELYKLWVLGIDEHLWQSRDGLHWTPGPKPDLRTDLAVCDPADPDPSRRFKAALSNRGFAVSPDGVRWTKTDTRPIPSSDESNLSYDPVLSKFLTDSQVPRVDRFVAPGDSCRRSFRCDFLDVGTPRSDYHRPTWEQFNLGSSSWSPLPAGSTSINKTLSITSSKRIAS